MLVDTHIWLWFLAGDSHLSESEVKAMQTAQKHQALFLSGISVWEVAMLQKQGRLALHQPIETWIPVALEGFQLIPIGSEIAIESVNLPDCDHKDPADRFIMATARLHSIPLLTHDRKILEYATKGFLHLGP